jgi:hypothetical protein
VALPRIGQEVLVTFLGGDIDRPVVVAALYNGRGQPNSQANEVAAGTANASGNAPMWFPGDQEVQTASGKLPGHAHGAVLSGIKTQAMSSSQSGHGGYNQLVFDDSPGASRLGLHSHASTAPGSHSGASELNLGVLRQRTSQPKPSLVSWGQPFGPQVWRSQPNHKPTATGTPKQMLASRSPNPASLNSAETRPMQVKTPRTTGQPQTAVTSK